MNCTSQYYLPKWKESCFWVPLLLFFIPFCVSISFNFAASEGWNFSLMFHPCFFVGCLSKSYRSRAALHKSKISQANFSSFFLYQVQNNFYSAHRILSNFKAQSKLKKVVKLLKKMFQMKPKKCKKKINETKLKNSDETKNWKKKNVSVVTIFKHCATTYWKKFSNPRVFCKTIE